MSETKTEETSKSRLVKVFSTDSYGVSRLERRLINRPFARLALAWGGLGNSALSPLSFCGISQLPPEEMWDALVKEKGFSIGLCFSTKLPVIHWDSGYANSHIENMYDDDWLNEYQERCEEERIGQGCPCKACLGKEKPKPEPRAKSKASIIPPKWDGFVEKFLGEDWKTYATREFDPFKTGCEIPTTHWDYLLNAYYLKLHKKGVPVSEEANSAYVEKTLKQILAEETRFARAANIWYIK